jgi:hypothetical protein
MKKENLFLLINALLLVFISIIFLFVIYPSLALEPEDLLFGENVTLDLKEVIETKPAQGNYQVILSKEIAFNTKGEEIGTVYTVRAQNVWKYDPNDEAGVIELLVGIQGEQVFVEIVELRQSSYYLASIQAYVKHFFNGVNYEDVEAIEIVNVLEPLAGATIAADSKQTIKNMVFNVVVLHFEIDLEEPDPFEDLFAENYAYALKDEAFTETTHVKERFVAFNESDERIGFVFRLYGFSVYNDDGGDGAIDMYLSLDIDENILNYLYINYGHSRGGFQGRINRYLDQTKGFHISSFQSEADLESGSTYSGALINQMLIDLSVVVDEYVEPDPFARFFDETLAYTEKELTFVETAYVKEMYVAYNEESDIIGYVFNLYGLAEYNEYGGNAAIEMYVVLDANLIILAYEFVSYAHTGGDYRNRITAYLNMMIGSNIANFNDDADLASGSTYTGTLIDLMFEDLSEVMLND